MGLNLDLTWLCNLPEEVRCPACNKMTSTGFDDFDVESPNWHPEKNKYVTTVLCQHCDTEISISVRMDTTPRSIVVLEIKY